LLTNKSFPLILKMHLKQQKRTVWLSGEVCETSGVYFSDICGHQVRKEFTVDDIFSRCPMCQQAIRWLRFGNSTVATPKRPDFGNRTPFVFYDKSTGQA
jgi:hypothetical protein